MTALTNWLAKNWSPIVIPLAVFTISYFAGLWIRRAAFHKLTQWAKKTRWQGSAIILEASRTPFILWFLILGAYLAIRISILSSAWVDLAGHILGSLFTISIIVPSITVGEKFLKLYLARLDLDSAIIALSSNIFKGLLLVIGLLIILDIWKIPTTPIILILGAAILWGAFAFRDVLPNLLAGMQFSSSNQIKVGDYIKLETGEEGYVTNMNWRNIIIESLEGHSSIMVPNRKLISSSVINYGRPLKQAVEPFRFSTRLHMKELTGLKAGNLKELVNVLKQAPDSIIYYHTHHYLEQHHFLTPQPSNDFALWVRGALGYEELGERLASIDILDFPTLEAIKERIINLIEDSLSRGEDARVALHGREFYFIKSISVILPTNFVAHDLREFVEILRKLSVESLYFHIFESRLRLGKGLNDFSIWVEDSLDDSELAGKIARLDPYFYTLEGLRSSLIQLIEKRIK